MTIRRTLQGWYRFLWVALLMVGALGRSWQDTGYNHAFRIGVISLGCGLRAPLFGFGFRCPRCRRTLVHKAPGILMQGGNVRSARTAASAWMRCGRARTTEPAGHIAPARLGGVSARRRRAKVATQRYCGPVAAIHVMPALPTYQRDSTLHAGGELA